jgi:hypothetical protein
VLASDIDAIKQKTDSSEWRFFFIVDLSDNQNSVSQNKSVEQLFNGKIVFFNNDTLSISNACSYKYAAQKMIPLEYWGNKQTVSYYESFFSDYNIKLDGGILEISPINPSENCDFPFYEFVILDDIVVFIYKNQAILYFKTEKDLIDHRKVDYKVVSSIVNKNSEKESFIKKCKDIERDENTYDTIHECYYKEINILDAYKKYRDDLVEGKNYLLETVTINKNVVMKCDNGCIEVNYKWNGPDDLIIVQQFNGGETEIHFSKDEQGTKVITKSSPD